MIKSDLVHIILAISFAFSCNSYKTRIVNFTKLKIKNEVIDLGDVGLNKKEYFYLEIKNIGDYHLIIKDIIPDCECLYIEYNKKPIPPKKYTKLKIIYTPKVLGKFERSIRLLCNTSETNHIITICGNVICKDNGTSN